MTYPDWAAAANLQLLNEQKFYVKTQWGDRKIISYSKTKEGAEGLANLETTTEIYTIENHLCAQRNSPTDKFAWLIE
jgi:hypothetical protein